MALDNRISKATAQWFQIPLPQVVEDAKHGSHTVFDVITVTLETKNGKGGTGYTYTGGRGGGAVFSLLEDDLLPLLLGKDASRVEHLWQLMQDHVHYVGRGGIVSFAVSAVDIALWDLRCKQAGEPLYKLAGGARTRTQCYCGGIDLGFTKEQLVDSVRGYLGRGFRAVKIKLGKPTLAEDLDRIAAVRSAIGPDIMLAVDANYGWTRDEAAEACQAFMDMKRGSERPLWLEEPTIPDDYAGYAGLRERIGMPLAMGENLHTLYEFQQAFVAGAVDFPQPDASNIGGVTGWLKVATLAQAFNLPVCSHGMQELHVSLLCAVPNGAWMEVHSFPIDEYTKRGTAKLDADGWALPPEEPGIGVEFDWEKLAPFRKKHAVVGATTE